MLQSASTTTEVVSDYVYDSGWSTVEKTSNSTTYMFSSVTPTYSATDANVILVDYISSQPTMYRNYLTFGMTYPTGATSTMSLSTTQAYANYNSHSLKHNTSYPYSERVTGSNILSPGLSYRLWGVSGGYNNFELPNGERAYMISPIPASATGNKEINFYVSSSAPNNTYHSGRVRVLTLEKALELFKEI